MVSETERNFEYIENANILAKVKHLEPSKKEREQKIKDIKEEIKNMGLELKEENRQIQIACKPIYDEEDRNVQIWGKEFNNEKFFGAPLDKESTKRELIEMDTTKAAEKHPEFYSRVMGNPVQNSMLLGEGHDIARPIEFFITDMFAVGLEAFKDREPLAGGDLN